PVAWCGVVPVARTDQRTRRRARRRRRRRFVRELSIDLPSVLLSSLRRAGHTALCEDGSVTADSVTNFSSLAMYPFASLREAWDELYANAARRVPDAPAALRWDLEAEDTWSHPQLELGMTCGWP